MKEVIEMINEAKKINYEMVQKNALKKLLLKNDKMLLQYLDDIICYDYELLDKIAGIPMEHLGEDMWEYVEKESIVDLLESAYAGKFNPYDDFFLMDKHGCLLSFKRKDYLEYIRREDRLNIVIDVLMNHIPREFLTYQF